MPLYSLGSELINWRGGERRFVQNI
jgi:hypothetical protein